MQYRVEDSGDEWDQVTVGGSGLETTVSELESGTKYEVQVRAVNDEGEGPWSESGKAETMVAPPANSLPEFDDDAVTTLSVPENTLAETAVGAPITATDSDSQDVLTYFLVGRRFRPVFGGCIERPDQHWRRDLARLRIP